jgi:polyribonucleotide nucleotidyltransferase
MPGIDGMLDVSQISDKRVERVEDVLKIGQKVRVRLVAIDDKGRLSLTMRNLD